MRRHYEVFRNAFAKGEVMPAIAEFYDPEIVFEAGDEWVFIEGGALRGHAEVARWFDGQLEVVEGMYLDPEKFIEAKGQIVVIFRIHGRGRHTGIDAGSAGEGQLPRQAHVWTMRDGKATRLVIFSDPAMALKAVGLAH
jgi:hypothetical protein